MKATILAIVVTLMVAGCATTTSPTGRKQMVGGVSQEQLNQLGAQSFAETKAKEKVVTGGKQNAYVNCVVDALVARLPDEWRQVAWETALFEDPEANAFALPGGKVGVNTGIFTVAKNQDQLAAVIGHEIGHVIARHHEERITKQMGTQQLLGVGAAILGARYGQGVGDAAGQLGGMGAQALFLLPGSRTQESEADVVGQRLMADAGFDPSQAASLWENMIAAGSARPPEWMSTHPDPNARIKEMQNAAPALMPVYEAARKAGRTPRCG
ncbi:peptidase [Pseudoxanthomonas kalamensis DSM 18571]|uniref:M48 family metallopeptidase n=1 Tax=Pseudoxanthomonas kalamensis TaxID=289483 RepID=UPI001390DECF|nr:M48 family metallopeptidase [Pseudoxanthomonas kalamensis]KAF1712327.1 peptidase [Pseudoxanthomonas kalamensis DSM 18571]